MAMFSDSKNGYDKQEVDAYLTKTTYEYESRLAEQKDRMFSLVDDNKKLHAMLSEYTKKNNEISTALVKAVETSKEIEQMATINYQNEIRNLQLFSKKWTGYFNRIQALYPMDENIKQINTFNNSVENVLENSTLSPKEKVNKVGELLDRKDMDLRTKEVKSPKKESRIEVSANELDNPLSKALLEKVNKFEDVIEHPKTRKDDKKYEAMQIMFSNYAEKYTQDRTSNSEKDIEENSIFAMYSKEKDRMASEPQKDYKAFSFGGDNYSNVEDREGMFGGGELEFMTDFGGKDVVESQFDDEFNPLGKIGGMFGSGIYNNYEDEKALASIDLDEVLYPKEELDLKDLCKEFDLID